MNAPGFLARSALGRALWRFRREFFWVGVFSFFANLLILTPTLYMLQIFDRVMISGSGLTLIALTGFAVFFFLVMAFAEWVRSRLLVRAGVRFDQALSGPVFASSFEARLQGSAAKPLQALTDLTQLRQFLTGNGVFAFFDTPWTVVYVLVLFMMHPVLGWTSVAMCAVMAVLAVATQLRTTPRHQVANDAVVATNTVLATKLRNAETVYAMGMLDDLRRLWLSSYEKQLAAASESHHVQHNLQAVVKFVQYLNQSLMLAVGALLVIDGEIGVGAMIASNALMANALRPIGMLVGTWRHFIEARQAYGRLEELLDEFPQRDSRHASSEVRGQITLQGLRALLPGGQPGTTREILRGLDAQFEAGEVIGVVGPSGAGKSTLARCLVGIWPMTQGRVLLDGHAITEWSREVLGPRVGYLPQDIELFDGTIAENIARFGQVDAEQVIEAAKRTGIHDMVLRFPKGYDTPMGEAGGMLSAGQRQRVGLARAIYNNPRLVVLDEPNANLDDVGEAALVRTVRELREQGSSVFLIVHQRAVLAACDRVVVMQDGQISQIARVQTGPAAAAPVAAATAGPATSPAPALTLRPAGA
jgi:ATP-binding cassette, subfamily C, bacterial exporter for protease/lipase